MLNRAILALLTVVEVSSSAHDAAAVKYDPSVKSEPFDAMAQTVGEWLKDSPTEVVGNMASRDWNDDFCDCMNHGYITSWYQMGPALYLVDTCDSEKGLILRTGHIQDRNSQILQSLMSCDLLKLMTYCFKASAPAALTPWNSMCMDTSYTVPSCEVDCSAGSRVVASSLVMIVVAYMLGRP
eukprot:gnl/TRDRNA2_/TRDRNA2_185051_c0_seq1.p1 gnl/TRDRNA2_/TRDRNA2_185051_c0~~gnl/TRDRNA2_/TRDRNA2_185051_c0_seq1.p1  ORF type:complete len:182 (+),score=31.79 gnl/TRDRNA2_/TRDRNA2_185051_c0_seq1:55-600(+)